MQFGYDGICRFRFLSSYDYAILRQSRLVSLLSSRLFKFAGANSLFRFVPCLTYLA
jgi:hypothetical protein